MHDDVQDTVKQIDDLIAVAHAEDAKVHELAAGARYAGDPQPYRVVDEDEAIEESTEFADSDVDSVGVPVSERR